MTMNESRKPPGIFDDPTFGLRERFEQALIPVAEFHDWWIEITGLRLADARRVAVDFFERARGRDGPRWCYRRSVVEQALNELHGRRLLVWLAADLEWAPRFGAGLATVGAGYPYWSEERLTVLDEYESVASACVRRALDLGYALADPMLAILSDRRPFEARKVAHEWGWTTGLPPETEDGLVPVAYAVRWWATTRDIDSLDAQTELTGELRIEERNGELAFRRCDLLAATRGSRLSTLRLRITNALDHLINHECSHSDLLAAPDVLRASLREALRLDPEEGAELLEWVRGYRPHIVEEIEEELS